MKKLLIILAIGICLSAVVAWALMDPQCFDDCLSAGYGAGYCQRLCSY